MAPKASDSPSSSHNTKSSMSSNKDQQPREQKQRRSGRSSSRRNKDLSGSFTGAKPSNGGPSGVSQPSAADRARQQQRRRPTNYTSSYTPPPGSLSRPSDTTNQQSQSSSGIKSSSRRKCSSLDRSEEEGDVRRRHLKSGGTLPSSSSNTTNEPLAEAANVIGGLSEQVQQRREQLQLQAMQAQLRLEREQLQHAQLQERQAFAQQERERQAAALQAQQQQQQGSSSGGERRESRGGSSRKLKSGVSSSRRKSEERESSTTSPNNGGSSPRKSSSSRSSRKSGERKSSHRRSSRDESNNTNNADTSERTEQQRIEEYAGKRALLRLEQELTDHSESNANAFSRSNSFSRDSSGDQEIYKSVMDRKKLARVPQVKKSDLIIGEYLGRGNFCDVFEITWIPEQTRSQSWNKSTQSFTYDTSQSGDESERSLENSMENLALSCSNDLNLVSDPRNGGITKSASRRSVSQVVGTGRGSFMGMSNSAPPSGGKGGGRRLTIEGLGSGGNLRNPNVLALKCLRPAVRAQPRKFVIGAEDLAHETALLACLDHPNIIQLYGRAEGCFSTAFQMRNKNGSNDNPSKNDKGEGKQMSNEGYFIILDRLMTTLTDRNDEWKDECRAINGVGPPPEGMPLPPESTLREHLCKRLKVAYCIADALEYLHSRHVVFRDLKPANVGFDCNDCVKMFDFGFATSIAPLLSQPYEGYGPLTETCGTRRYMATEVALKLGYGKEVDVYSFGMLLWEICALDKPFDSIQSVDEFHDLVVLCGRRPSLNIDPLWTPSLKNLMSRCWSTDPLDRPTMVQVKSLLCNVLRDMNKAMEKSGDGRVSARGGGSGSTATHQQRQEQGGNFMHKWRRRVSI